MSAKTSSKDGAVVEKNTSLNDGFLSDGDELARLGLESHTKRDINLIGIIAVGWNICNSWAAVAATMVFSILSGGPVTLIYGIILIFVLAGSAAASMAEIASVYPTAGGQYHWTSILAPKRWSVLLGYTCGAINLLGWIATAAGFVITTAQLIAGLAMVTNQSYVAEPWHVFLVFELLNVVFVAYNMLLMKRTAWVHDVGFVISLVGFLVILITCLARNPPKMESEFVWTGFINNTGWESSGIVFLTGLINPNFIYSGLDGAIHLAEECKDAAKTVPKALMSTIIVGFITAFSFAVAMTYFASDYDAVMSSPIPIVEIWTQATGSQAAAVTFGVIVTVCGCFACVGCHQTASRLTYSFARDNALVFSTKLSHVNETFGVPIIALFANGVIVALIGLLYLASSAAFNAMVATGMILLQISFAVPVAVLMWRKRSPKYLPPTRSFRLGPFGWVANALCIVLAVVSLIFYCFPAMLPVEPATMNYASVVIAVMALFAVANWFGHASTQYHGPRVDDD